jgi:hypothetical protein
MSDQGQNDIEESGEIALMSWTVCLGPSLFGHDACFETLHDFTIQPNSLLTGYSSTCPASRPSMKFAVKHSNNQQHQNRNDRNRNQPIRRHPIPHRNKHH